MIEGMMWSDHSKDPIEKKVENLVNYYKTKYNKTPNICHVHPTTCEKGEIYGVKIVHDQSILPNSYWIGQKTKK